ncbi:MAG: hypothetical protein WC364_10295 [Eubacteriales bacterium]|jgi:hypothetical protein
MIVEYRLNEVGRKQALLSGGNGKQWQTIEIKPTAELLRMATVECNGEAKLQLRVPCLQKSSSTIEFELEGYDFLLRKDVELLYVSRFGDWVDFSAPLDEQGVLEKVRELNVMYDDCIQRSRGEKKAREEIEPELPRLFAEARELAIKKAAEQEKAEQEKKALEQQENDYLNFKDTIINFNGTVSQVERYAAGLLSSAETEKILEDHIFGPLSRFPEYELMNNSEVCKCALYGLDPDECKVKYSSWAAEEADDEEFTVFKAIKGLIPQAKQAKVQLRVHEGVASQCGGRKEKRGVMVNIEILGHKFSREYAC